MSTTRGQHLIGRTLGSCVLEKLLGYGGSSAVFLAQQHSPERKVAVKVFLPRTTMDSQTRQDFYQRFLREARAASGLHHSHILPIHSYGEEDDLLYIIMPYMQGGTLYEYVSGRGCLSLNEVGTYLEQIASALDYAHEHGCVHCDVKPANILLDGEGHVLLSDFGIARLTQDGALARQGETEAVKRPESLMGTPDYISPEQALGQDLDRRSDVYSLGVTLFFLLTGRPPFIAETPIAMALLHVHEPPPSLRSLHTDMPPEVDHVIRKALAKFPEERFRSAGHLGEAFKQALAVASEAERNALRPKVSVASPGRSSARLFSPVRVVHVKPAWLYTLGLPRVLLIGLLLLLVAVGASVTAGAITLRIVHGSAYGAQATVVPDLSGDALAVDGENDWPKSNTFFFANGQYHIQNKSAQDIALALYANHLFSNFALTITMTEVRGSHNDADYYGVVLRASPDQSHYYVLEVASAEAGQYEFLRYDGQWKTLAAGPVPSLLPDAQANTVSVRASGALFNFFINGQHVGTPVTDSSRAALSSGDIGLYVEEQGTEVAFSHLRISASK
ncbi:MAG: serine/threonine protein kinase [Chloroflexota bacterium]|nr:serine/threonine protein kinase [Chloroflexota bacterium]